MLCLCFPLGNVVSLPHRPRSKICQAVDLVRRILEETDSGLSAGCIYVKVPQSTKTFVYSATIDTYLNELLENPIVADVLTPLLPQLTVLLSHPSCKVIKPLTIDYNFIEVSNGYFFNISEKKFQKNPNILGSARTFCRYKYDGTIPKPKFFIQGMYLYYFISCYDYRLYCWRRPTFHVYESWNID